MVITSEFFHQLISLEDLLGQGNVTYELIQHLIDLYAKCIEHYDSIQDPVGYYFNEKLQGLFTHQKALLTIRKTNAPVLEVPKVEETKVAQLQPVQKQIISAEGKKKERQMKAKIAMQIQDQFDNNKDSLESMIQGYQRAQNHTKSMVISDLQKQEDKIQERMKRRQETKRTHVVRNSAHALSQGNSTEKLEAYDESIFLSTIGFPEQEGSMTARNPIREADPDLEDSVKKVPDDSDQNTFENQ